MVYPDKLDEYHPDTYDVIQGLSIIHANETPAEWRERILPAIEHFKSKKLLDLSYMQANKVTEPNVLVELNIFLCLYCFQLVYYNVRRPITSLGLNRMEEHLKTRCTLKGIDKIVFERYVNLKNRSNINEFGKDAIRIYELWLENATAKLKRAREVGKKMQAVKIIQSKWLEYMYRPEGLKAVQLATHYELIRGIRQEKLQNINS